MECVRCACVSVSDSGSERVNAEIGAMGERETEVDGEVGGPEWMNGKTRVAMMRTECGRGVSRRESERDRVATWAMGFGVCECVVG